MNIFCCFRFGSEPIHDPTPDIRRDIKRQTKMREKNKVVVTDEKISDIYNSIEGVQVTETFILKKDSMKIISTIKN